MQRVLNREYHPAKLASHPMSVEPETVSAVASLRPSSSFAPGGEEFISDGRAHKRLRLSQSGLEVSVSGLADALTSDVCQILGHPNSTGLNGLSLVASYVNPDVNISNKVLTSCRDSFSTLSQNGQCELLGKLGSVACAGAGALNVEKPGTPFGTELRCTICDNDHSETGEKSDKSGNIWKTSQFDELQKVATELVPQLQRSAKPRIAGMLALRHILMHDPNDDHVRLVSSAFGEWCLHSLRSSVRELRVVAG